MKLSHPFIQLPLLFDAAAMAAEISTLGEGPWRPHPQGFSGNSMLPLLAAHGDAANESFVGKMLPTPELLECPYLMQVLESLGATLGRTRLMRLAGQAEVTQHADQGYYWADRVRVHVPVVTQPTVRFECGDAAINMAAGECWIFDTWRLHRVLNDAVQARIHMVADTVGGDGFWKKVDAGKPIPSDKSAAWEPVPVPVLPGIRPTLTTEAVSFPAVMTPWELKSLFGLLFADSMPHAQLPVVHALSRDLARAWQGLWAQYGDAVEGRPHFRELLEKFIEAARVPGGAIRLRNGLAWYNAMFTLIGKPAVSADQPSATRTDEYGLSDRA